MEKFVETLNNNPIFQLSLSSKELFHSNFLAWLAEDDNTRCVFNRFFSNFGTFMYLSLRRPLSAKEKSMLFHP